MLLLTFVLAESIEQMKWKEHRAANRGYKSINRRVAHRYQDLHQTTNSSERSCLITLRTNTNQQTIFTFLTISWVQKNEYVQRCNFLG